MEAGRELDYTIYYKVMGLAVVVEDKAGPLNLSPGSLHFAKIISAPVKKYSTDIKDAWDVVEKLKQKEPIIQYDSELNCWHAGFKDKPDHYFMELSKDSASHAICLAALKSVGG